jgi:hypothetical protein
MSVIVPGGIQPGEGNVRVWFVPSIADDSSPPTASDMVDAIDISEHFSRRARRAAYETGTGIDEPPPDGRERRPFYIAFPSFTDALRHAVAAEADELRRRAIGERPYAAEPDLMARINELLWENDAGRWQPGGEEWTP